jgi:RES domain-containing protein
VAVTDGLIAADILAGLPARPWEGVVYRLMLADYPPERENIVGARWNPAGIGAIYTSESAEIAIAEVTHHLLQQPRPVRRDLKKTLYEIKVALAAVVHLEEVIPHLERAGIPQHLLVGSDLNTSQAIGKTVTWLDRDGLMVPSARARGKNLVIYPTYTKDGSYRFEVLSQVQI